ncbi:sensor histidine kinase [Ohtaekwangia sp.]|uniref:sensor histidine kinase n=1 Tax=Ohtaekwangia sp. TaxID=2066019 RepID=UPI002F933E55
MYSFHMVNAYRTERLVKKAGAIMVLIFLLPLTINAQRLFIRQYLADEYKAGQNEEIVQGKDGMLYIANVDGLVTFDGYEWRTIFLPKHQAIYSLAVDSLENVYVGGIGEFGFFQRNDTGERVYHSLMHLVPAVYHNDLQIIKIMIAGDDVIFLSSNYIILYRQGTMKLLDFSKPRDGFFIKKDTQVYYLHDHVFYVYKDGNFVASGMKLDNAIDVRDVVSYLPGQYMVLDSDSRIWIFDPTQKTGKKTRLLTDKVAEYTNGSWPMRIRFLANGLIAVLTEGNLIFFGQNGEKIYHIKPDVLRYIYLNDFFEDSEHNLWISGNREILQVITSSSLSFYNNDDGIHHKILSLFDDGKYLYVGSGWGFYTNVKGTSEFKVVHGADGYVAAMYQFDNKVYAAHATGVWELNGENKKLLLSQEGVIAICKLKGKIDRFLIATALHGTLLMERKGNGWGKKKLKGVTMQANYIEEDNDGLIWISHENQGVSRMRLNDAKDSVIESHFYDSHNGLPSDVNNRVYHLKSINKIIVTTENGIYTFNTVTQRFEPYEPINAALGGGICIYTIADNAAGDIYFWGAQPHVKEFAGLLKKQNGGRYKLITQPFNKIEKPIGDLRVDVYAPIFVSQNGSVLIGNDLRLIFFNPGQKTFFNEPMPVSIKHIWADDTLIYRANRKSMVHELPYALNNLRFEVTSCIFEDPEKVKFQFKLEGFDSDWSDWQSTREAVYTNLPDGHYTFSVRAKDQYDRVSAPALYSFAIRPPWYKTVWAMMMFLSVLIWSMYFIVRIYTWRVKAQKRFLQAKVSEQNHELLTQNEELSAVNEELAAINEEIHEKNKAISNQARELEKLNATKDKLFSIVSHDLRGPVRQVQDILNLIDLNYISEKELRAMMPKLKDNVSQTLSLTENLLFWAKNQMEGIQVKPSVFNMSLIVDENIQLLRPFASSKHISLINAVSEPLLVYADSDMIRLVLRNLMSNAIKFTSKGGVVTVEYKRLIQHTLISVEDTGTGMSEEEVSMLMSDVHFTKYGTSGEKGAGIGFNLCKEFIEKNGGVVTVTSELYKGSKFSFTVPNNV